MATTGKVTATLSAMIAVLTISLMANLVHANVMTLQYSTHGSGYQGGVDGAFGTSASYGSTVLALGPVSGSSSVGLTRFDDANGTGVGTIPSTATVTSATLTLIINSNYNPANTGTLYAAPVTSSWTGLGVVSPAPGVNTGSAVSAPLPNTSTFLANVTTITFDVTSIVQSWVNGSLANNGVAIYGNAVNYGVKYRSSNLGYNGTNAPILNIAYTVPEPASLAMFGLGGGLLFIRRRKIQ